MAVFTRHSFRSSTYSSATLNQQRIHPIEPESKDIHEVVTAILGDLISCLYMSGDRVKGSGGLHVVLLDGIISELKLEINLDIYHSKDVPPETDEEVIKIELQDEEIF